MVRMKIDKEERRGEERREYLDELATFEHLSTPPPEMQLRAVSQSVSECGLVWFGF
jgi:hypothetical protein